MVFSCGVSNLPPCVRIEVWIEILISMPGCFPAHPYLLYMKRNICMNEARSSRQVWSLVSTGKTFRTMLFGPPERGGLTAEPIG
jgi:hypothetical protein